MGKKTRRIKKTLKLVNVLPKLTLPLMSTKVIAQVNTIGLGAKKVLGVMKQAFTKQD